MTVTTARRHLVPVLKALAGDVLRVVEDGEADVLVYLVDRLGGNLGYSWEWERFGPFSEDLAAELAELTAEDLVAPGGVDPDLAEVVESVRRMIDHPIAGLDEKPPCYKTVRLLASVHFARTRMRADLGNGGRPSFLKRHFAQDAVDKAIARLDEADAPVSA